MKPPPFEYFAAETLQEAVSLMREHEGDARILAGGQSLVPLLNMRLARPAVLVDANRVAELDYIRESDGWLAIGAMTRQRAVERSELVRSRQPLLHAATMFVGHPQIRNRGTVGGCLAHAHPAAEYSSVAVALGAEMTAAGPNGKRSIRAEDFFVTYLTTALEPAEVLTEVRVPTLPERSGWSFVEVARRHGDFALAGAAVTVSVGDDGACSDARIALFGVAPTPVRAPRAEQGLSGQKGDDRTLEDASRQASEEIEAPPSDIHASSEYRRHLVRVLTRRAVAEAVTRAHAA